MNHYELIKAIVDSLKRDVGNMTEYEFWKVAIQIHQTRVFGDAFMVTGIHDYPVALEAICMELQGIRIALTTHEEE